MNQIKNIALIKVYSKENKGRITIRNQNSNKNMCTIIEN